MTQAHPERGGMLMLRSEPHRDQVGSTGEIGSENVKCYLAYMRHVYHI